MNNKNSKLNKHTVICSDFVCLYDMFTAECYDEHDTKESAINQLLHGDNECLCMPIAVIDIKQRKMVWFHDYIGKKECESRVNLFLKNNCL